MQPVLGKSLDIYSDLHDLKNQARLYANFANVYWRMGETDKAIKELDVALDLLRTAKDRDDEAVVQRAIAYDELFLGDEAAAQRASGEAVRIHRELNYLEGEAGDLGSFASALRQTGQLQRALDMMNQELNIHHQAANQRAKAYTLISIGYVYTLLSAESKSLEYWSQSRQIFISLGVVGGTAQITRSMSTALANTGQTDKALDYATQALILWRDIENPWGEANTLHTLVWIYENLCQHEKALAYFRQALPTHRLNNDNDSLYYTLRGMGQTELALGNFQNARDDDLAALAAAKKRRDPPYIGQVDSTLMQYWRARNQPQLATFFGVEAVNNFQLLRKNIQGLDQGEQVQFAQSKSQVYRQLAELLVQQDRLGEAEHVLDLLKREEFQEVVRGGPPDAAGKVNPLPLSAGQKKAEAEMSASEDRALALMDLTTEYDALEAKKIARPTKPPASTPSRRESKQKIVPYRRFSRTHSFPTLRRRPAQITPTPSSPKKKARSASCRTPWDSLALTSSRSSSSSANSTPML
jgi:tetratricopeptide (TPR) repeat protein